MAHAVGRRAMLLLSCGAMAACASPSDGAACRAWRPGMAVPTGAITYVGNGAGGRVDFLVRDGEILAGAVFSPGFGSYPMRRLSRLLSGL